jgi:hypothetical protein
MRAGRLKHHGRFAPTRLGWLVVALGVAVIVGLAIGLKVLWLAALVVLLLLLLGAFAIPRNVHDLNVPPGMPNMPGDVTRHERESED